MDYFAAVPDDCLSTIISLTSPPDACRSSMASSTFRSAADSDSVWENFLPSGYWELASRSITPFKSSSKKELYFRLCDSILIDGGSKSFKLDKLSGKKSYVLSARELSIPWFIEPIYWIWKSIPESRFSEVAVLRTVWWLEIEGKIGTKMLSPNTTYGAYLIMKISESAYGLDSMPSEISVTVGNHAASTNTAFLRRRSDGTKEDTVVRQQFDAINRIETLTAAVNGGGGGQVPRGREDGWMEIELGEFFSGDGSDEEVKMSLKEVKGCQLKGGLTIEGIEVRPKHH